MNPLRLSLWLLCLAIAYPALAGSEGALRPPSSPTEVHVGLKLVGLSKVDPPNESFPTYNAEFLLHASWEDPREAFDSAETEGHIARYHGSAVRRRFETLWQPDLTIENEEGPRITEHQELEIHPDGTVRYLERFAVEAHANVDLRRFPFDSQSLELYVAPFAWSRDHVRLVLVEDGLTHDREHENLEWRVLGLGGKVIDREGARPHTSVSTLKAAIHVERIPGFYLYKLLLPLLLIVVFTWSAFWMKGEGSAGRMQRTFVALLTVVAFHHIVAGHLPKISYLTFVDAVVYAAFLSVGATLLQVVRIHNATHRGDEQAALRMERTGRIGHPLGFGLLVLGLWVTYHLL
ncbi:MAG: hypothetical protein EA397_00800 [Deltaproteobacteria bacterium]|nr:MAG: hypothetical protein EA397_00800 [Deltaproteobacteria bacterium]